MRLKKYSGNPILSPNPENEWESLVTTNPAAWYDEENKEVLLVYRASGDDAEHLIYVGLAKSKDGYNFTRASAEPIMGPCSDSWDGGSVEDVRMVRFGEYYFLTYAGVASPPGRYWENPGFARDVLPDLPMETPCALRNNLTRTGLAITKDFKTFYRTGYMTDATYDDRDTLIFPEKINGKFVTVHRPSTWVGEKYGCEQPSIWISYCDDLLEHKELSLFVTAQYDWEKKIGAASPPIKTDKGWLMLYHAVGEDSRYRVGALLLDVNDPRKVLCRTPEPILVPEYEYECTGIYPGICFPCGNVVIDDTLFVYYGGADQYVGVATCPLDELLGYLLENPVI